VISLSQRPLPDNTQQTNIHARGGIRTHDHSRRAAVDLHLRPRGHWDRKTYDNIFINLRETVLRTAINMCWGFQAVIIRVVFFRVVTPCKPAVCSCLLFEPFSFSVCIPKVLKDFFWTPPSFTFSAMVVLSMKAITATLHNPTTDYLLHNLFTLNVARRFITHTIKRKLCLGITNKCINSYQFIISLSCSYMSRQLCTILRELVCTFWVTC
jgi:hypothetical protein